MLTIKYNSENKEELLKYLKEEDLKLFSDAYTYASKAGDGIFKVEDKGDFAEIDLFDCEIFCSRGFIVEDIRDIFKALCEKFPGITLSGDYAVQLKYSDHIVEFTYGGKSKKFKENFLCQCEQCGKKAVANKFLISNDETTEGICSFKCAFRYLFNVQKNEDGKGYTGYDEYVPLEDFDEEWEDWFWDMFIENIDKVLTKKNAELVLELMSDECENEDAIAAVEEWIDENIEQQTAQNMPQNRGIADFIFAKHLKTVNSQH